MKLEHIWKKIDITIIVFSPIYRLTDRWIVLLKEYRNVNQMK